MRPLSIQLLISCCWLKRRDMGWHWKPKKKDGLYSSHTGFFENTSGFIDGDIQQQLNLNAVHEK